MPDEPQFSKRGLPLATAAELGDLLHELSHHKDRAVRRRVGKLIKEVLPDSPHAQAFVDVDMESRQEEWERRQEEAQLLRESEARNRELERQRNALLTGGADGEGRKFTEDQVKEIETLMQTRGVRSYEDGATLYAATNPPVDPTHEQAPRHGASYEFPTIGGMSFDDFAKNPSLASRNMAHELIDEINRRKRA